MAVLASVKSNVGQEIARWRRKKRFPTDAAYLPPNLRARPTLADFAPDGTFAATLPVSLYWGMERNVDLDGVRPPGVPRWLGHFDWVVGFEYGWADTTAFPSSVFCEPRYLPALLTFLRNRWPEPPHQRSLLAVTVGPDFLLSWQRKRVLRDLARYFTCIFYEAKDVEIPGIGTLPMGLTEHYSRSNGALVVELAQEPNRSPRDPETTPTVLAAWGAWWPGLDDLIPDRHRARIFAAQSPLVDERQLSSDEWFRALTEYDYMLCPLGNGVQAPKMVEALMMGCIPIATRHPTFVELSDRGMPILLIDEWEDISEELLKSRYSSLFEQVQDFCPTVLELDKWWAFSFPCHDHESAHLPDVGIGGRG